MSYACDLEDAPAFYTWTEPVARKVHRCCECDAPIGIGEKHFSCTGKWHGEIQTMRQHLLCMEACMFVRDKIQGGDCISFGGLEEFFADYSPYPLVKSEPITKRLRNFMAQIRWRERKEKISLPPKRAQA